MKKHLDEKKGERWIFFSFFLNTHVKLCHTNAKWYTAVIKLCPHVHRTVKADVVRKTESDFRQP